MNEKIKQVGFISENVEASFESLKEGKFEDKQLYNNILKAKEELLKNHLCGIRVKEKQIPKEYVQKYGITALWKYDLPNAWRLLYTILGNDIKIVSVILEWMSHKDYERKFNY